MSSLLWLVSDRSLGVLYRRINVVDVDIDEDDEAALDDLTLEEPTLVVAGPGWLACLCGPDQDRTVVDFEAWDGEPVASQGFGVRSVQLRTQFPSGTLTLGTLTGGESQGPQMVLPYTDDRTYEVRISVQGVADVGGTDLQDPDPDEVGSVQRWLFQFWAST